MFTAKCLKFIGITTMLTFTSIAANAEWRGWNIHVPDYPVSIAMDQFTDDLERLSQGELTGKTYHNGVLGNGADAISQVRLGALDFAVISLGPLGTTVDAANVASLPFIFTGVDQMHRVLDSEIGKHLKEAMADEGFIVVGWYDSGARSFYNNSRPIRTPSDLEGMKIRVMGNEIFVNMVNNMGGNGTPMPFGEVYQALRTGVIDGAENNYPSYESTNHFEVAKYYSLTEHLIIPECLCIAKQTWEKLSDSQKDIVRKAGLASQETQRRLWAEREAASLKVVTDAGSIVNTIDDKAPFQELMTPVYATFIKQYPDLEGLVNDLRAFK